jgi:integrase
VGSVIKKQVTKALPAGAEICVRKGERFARWKDRRGKARTARLTTGQDGKDRIIVESGKWFAKYRDGAGVVQVVPTGCKDETAARQVLADLERKAELVRSGMISATEAAVAEHLGVGVAEHFDAFRQYMEAAGVTPGHVTTTRHYLDRLAAECGFARLADLRREKLEAWLVARGKEGMSARSRNAHRDALVAFCNWCVDTDRLTANPFARIPKANEKADPRRRRRAMTEDELVRLLAVARERPLLDALTVRTGARKGERGAKVRPEVRERLRLLGRERALTYKTLVLTGLRKKELASLTPASLHLDGPVPYVVLDAADEKNREGNEIPLRDDLAADLRQWLADKLKRLQDETRAAGSPIPARLPPDTPVFDVPDALVKILDRDLVAAGLARRVRVGKKWRIDKRDDRGRTIDVHALRTTFGTLMSKGGVAPRTAQAAMRHSKIDLTMNVYTDPALLDVRGALDALPPLPLEGDRGEGEAVRATGTDDATARKFAPGFAPKFAPTPDNQGVALSPAGNPDTPAIPSTVGASGSADKRNDPPTNPVSGSSCGAGGVRTRDLLNAIQHKGAPDNHQNPYMNGILRQSGAGCKLMRTVAEGCKKSRKIRRSGSVARKFCGRTAEGHTSTAARPPGSHRLVSGPQAPGGAGIRRLVALTCAA